MTRRLSFVVAAVAALALLASPAAAVTGTTLFAAPDVIAAQPTVGQSIDDLAVDDGQLLVGHGDYSLNTGPTEVVSVDLTTGAVTVPVVAPSEEVNTFRTFRGHVFAPWVDPTGWGGAVNGGFTTDEAGWDNIFTTPAGHLYDYTEAGTSRFLAGAIAYGGAGLWQSDNGGPWQLVLEENSAGGATGWERFYWTVTLKGKVYAQAKHNGGTAELPSGTLFKMKVWDGSRWKTSKASVGGVTAGHQIEVFRDRAYYGVSAFDGNRTVRSGAPFSPRDFYADGSSYLYAVASDGNVARTANGSQWEALGRVILPDPYGARSVAVSGPYVYVGTSVGTVYRSTL